MKLPSLSDLDLESDLEEYEDENIQKKKVSKVNKSSPKANPTKSAEKAKPIKKAEPAEENERKESGKPKIPKSQYDAHGKPVLAIPDLNDIDLSKEINRFFD